MPQKEAEAAAKERGKVWGSALGSTVRGKRPDDTRGSRDKTILPTDFNVQVGAFKVKEKGEGKSTNPYAWPEDDPRRIPMIAKLFQRMDVKFVTALAKSQGCSVNGKKLAAK